MYFVVILAGGLSLVYGAINAGDLVAYVLYVSTLIATIRRIVEFAEQFQRGMTGIERFAEIMDTPVTIADAPDAKPLVVKDGGIDFDDVSFEYPDDHNKVLRHVDLHIRPGENVALVGPSGGGKTTLCNLIPRFYDVTGGKILIDGQDVRGVTLHSLRGAIGVVQQDVYLFSGTVAENIAYGRPGATRAEIEEAARLAGADAFVRALKDGYDTYVGERGVKLSGGQKQRLAIARVFLKNPRILLLDEATSALDPQTTGAILQLLKHLNEKLGITIVIITHEMAVVKEICDRVAVMEHGNVVEEGDVFSIFAAPKAGITRDFIRTTSNLQKIEKLIEDKSPLVALKPGEKILRLNYIKKNTSEALISETSRKFNINLNIIFADLEIVQDAPIGGTVAIASGKKEDIEAAVEYLKEKNVGVEVLENG